MRHRSLLLLLPILTLVAAMLPACSHDPNVRKLKYVESGERYFNKGETRRLLSSSIMPSRWTRAMWRPTTG